MKSRNAMLVFVGFLVLLLVGDRAFSLLLQEVLSFSNNRYISLYEAGQEPGILVFGNSRADRHFTEPELEKITGREVTNLGLGGVSTLFSEALFYDYVNNIGMPELLIIEPTYLKVDPGEIGDMRLLGIYSRRVRELTRKLKPRLYYASSVFHIFYFNNELFLKSLFEIFRKKADRRAHGELPDRLLEKWRKEKPEPTQNSNYSMNEQALLRILQYAEERCIPTRVILTPYFYINGAGTGAFSNNWISRLQGLIGDQEILDYTELLHDKTLFRDRLHMNNKGAEQFHRALIADGVFSDLDQATDLSRDCSGNYRE